MINIYKKEIGKKIKEITIDGNFVITFEDDTKFELAVYHEQDCCENVYADFDYAKAYLPQLQEKEELKVIEIYPVEDIGFIISIQTDTYDVLKKVLIPCYNSQNGYYSTDLELQIESEGVEIKIDITDLVEDNIN